MVLFELGMCWWEFFSSFFSQCQAPNYSLESKELWTRNGFYLLLSFLKGKAKFESDCVDYEGDKTAANLLSVSFKNLSDGAVVLSGLPPFKDEIGFYESWTSFYGVMAAGDRTESVRHVVEADIEVKQQHIYSACYNLGPFEFPLMTLLKITSNKHLRKPPVGQFHGFNSRLFCTCSSCTMKGLCVRKCVSGKNAPSQSSHWIWSG